MCVSACVCIQNIFAASLKVRLQVHPLLSELFIILNAVCYGFIEHFLLLVCLFVCLFVCFWPWPWHVEVTGKGIEATPQLWQ